MVAPRGDHHDGGMGARRALVVLSVCGLLDAACSNATTARPAVSPSPSRAASAGIAVQAVIDLKAKEALGLAVDSTAVWAVAYQGSSLSRVDPTTNTVTSTVRLDNAASALAADGAIWVAAYGGGPADSALYRLDPATGRVVARVDAGEVCCDLSAGDGGVWVVDPRGAVLRVDEATNRVTQRFDVVVDRNAHINAVYAGGSVWVSSDTTPLVRIDARTGTRTTIDVGGGVPFLVDEGLVWGAAPDKLWALDQTTGRVARRVDLANSTEVISLAVGLSAIWVGIRRPGRVGAVLRLDPTTGQLRNELRDIEIPARIAIGFGSVWVTDSGSTSLYRLTPSA
jgi:streptogramin lyase